MNVVTQFPAARDYKHDLRFRAMFEGAAIGMAICRFDGRILEANPALSRILGYNPRELEGAYADALCPGVHCELGREISSAERSSGTLSLDELPPDELRLGDLMSGKCDSFSVEKRYRRKDGSELWGHLTLSVARDHRCQPAFLIAMLVDASERKRTEERLRQAEKMAVIGQLTGGIAHDFNNLLTGILLYCDLLSAGFANAGFEKAGFANDGVEGVELNRHVEEVRMASEQGAALTRQLLTIARKQAAEPRPIAIYEIVASSKNLLRRLLGEQIELITVPDAPSDSSAGLVLADPAQLRQIVFNLVLNARDAMPQGGKIALSTQTTEFPHQVLSEVSSAAPASFEFRHARRAVSLLVKDTGCGMDGETRARLFEPFFTTKKPGRGTGLGLATVQRIVGELGGVIEVQSEPGRGTSIEVFLPGVELMP